MTDENEKIEEQVSPETEQEPETETGNGGRDEEMEQLRADLESARGQVARLEHERILLGSGVPEEDLDYYTFKIERMEGAQDDFAKAAKEYLKAHPIKRATVSSGAELGGSRRAKPRSASEIMNEILRNH